MLKGSHLLKLVVLVGLVIVILTGKSFGQITKNTKYLLTDIGSLGGDRSLASSINNAGQVVGYSFLKNGDMYHAFLYSNGSIMDIGTLGGNLSFANEINNAGQIVGGSTIEMDESCIVFLYSNGKISNEGISMLPNGINSKGQVVGETYSGNNLIAVTYQNGLFAELGSFGGISGSASAINYNDQIVGYADYKGGPRHAFLFENDTMNDIGTLGGNWSVASDINNSGSVVGSSSTKGDLIIHAFLYKNKTMQDLGSLKEFTSSAYGVNIHDDVIGSFVVNTNEDTHAFLYSDGSMKDLNELIDQSSGWVLEVATAINDSGQIVGFGKVNGLEPRSFLLDPLPRGAIELIEQQPDKPVYGNLPIKEDGKDSLVVITHGWQMYLSSRFPPDISWVDGMSNAISSYLKNHAMSNWQVHDYKWVDNAWKINPEDALNNAKQEGIYLGNAIASQRWTHVHFIGHSAGAGLIQSATDVIKNYTPTNTIQCTFLDPFVGFMLKNKDSYGNRSDWSDSYVSDDLLTGGEFYPLTDSLLNHTYNVDITYLNKIRDISSYISTSSGISEPCMRTVASHGWPIDFYLNTIIGNVNLEYEGFGFPLSKEGGGWNYAIKNYEANANSWKTLGIPDSKCIQYFDNNGGSYNKMLIDIVGTPSIDVGSIEKWPAGIELKTHSPSWTAMFIKVTNTINSVSFDSKFTSVIEARGLLSIYWDTNMIGSFEEEFIKPGFNNYILKLPTATSNSTHVLGLRLDQLTNIQSSVIMTNIVLGTIGIDQPFNISIISKNMNGLPIFRLEGQAGFNYTVQASTNLIDWDTVAILVNTTGNVNFTDNYLTNNNQRFYRVICPN